MPRLRLLALALASALAACAPAPQPANPALWRIDGPQGQTGWLFGTIHALERPALWRSEKVSAALAGADRIVVEIADPADKRNGAVFAALATSPGHGPLSGRVGPELRPALTRMLDQGGLKDDGFASTETWAAALTIARSGGGTLDSAHGIDRAVIDATRGKPVIELEGTAGQLALFDALPEDEQRDLLALVIKGSNAEGPGLAGAWRKGDMARIERETHAGLLADAELRDVLFTRRNRSWADRLDSMLKDELKPFVAVGAAHMTGEDGLPALLVARGYRVTRIQ